MKQTKNDILSVMCINYILPVMCINDILSLMCINDILSVMCIFFKGNIDYFIEFKNSNLCLTIVLLILEELLTITV